MEMERVTIDLPIVKVEPNQPIWSQDFAKERYEYGLMIVDDGVMRNFVFYDGTCVFNMPCPHDVIEKHLVEEKYELEFNYDKVVELAEPLMHYLNEVGCPDGIRVSQLGIIHEPMSTLIFDNGIGE